MIKRSLLSQAGCAAFLSVVSGAMTGCLTLKAEHNDLAAKVAKLETATDDRSAKLDQEIEEAEKRLLELQAKLDEAEKLLRGSQAGLGARMDDVETRVAELRGAAEQAEFVSSAANTAMQELRGDVDQRVAKLEEKLNEATNIPESKDELWNESERQLKGKNYKQARRLFRTYVSRYPGDARLAEAMFKVGLTFYGERDYKSALGEFYRIIQEQPESPTIPDALYYSGLSFAKLQQCKNAIAYFEAVQKPSTNASDGHKKQAQSQIDILKKDTGEMCLDAQDQNAGAAGKQAVDKAASTTAAPESKTPAKTTRKR